MPASRPPKPGAAAPAAAPSAAATAAAADTGATAAAAASATGQVHALPGTRGGDFDAARVAAIREDIRAGRYQVNPERIASGLLDSVRDLLGAERGK